MLNININTYAIDFSLPGWSGKRGSLRAQKRGIRLHWIRFGGFTSAVISWNSNFSPWSGLISSSEFIVHLFSLSFVSSGMEKKRCSSLKERKKLWSPSILSFFLFFANPMQPPPLQENTGFVLQQFRGDRRSNMWVFNGNNTVCFSSGASQRAPLKQGWPAWWLW